VRDSPTLKERQRLGDFEIIRPLGKGGMGEVYEAQQGNPPRRVALKVLAAWLAEDEEALQRFWREVTVPAQLDHPGIVPIISCGRTDEGVAYYTMRLVRGPTLSQLVRALSQTPQPPTVLEQTTSEHPLPASGAQGEVVVEQPGTAEEVLPEVLQEYQRDRYGLAVRVGIQAGRALAAAHRVGVLHRDIKLSNLMIDGHRQVYLVDFGLTKALSSDGMSTRPGVVCGTPWYMSPEQARGDVVDGRTDIYALGVALYELVTGGLGPYTASRQDRSEVLRQVRSGQVLPVRGFAPEIPAGLEQVLQRALQPKASRRYQVAEEVVADLERLQQELATATPKPSAPRRAVLRRTAVGVALALLAGLSVTAGAWLAGRGLDSHKPLTISATATNEEPALTGAPAAALLKPLPPPLRDRVPGLPVNLQMKDYEPLWGQGLRGKGGTSVVPTRGLSLCGPTGDLVLLALDNPGRRGFEFSIQMSAVLGTASTGQGVFFGYQPRNEHLNPAVPFFRVSVVEPLPEGGLPPRLDLRLFWFREIPAAQQDSQWAVPVGPPNEGKLVLPPRDGRWRTLRVRATADTVTVSVDKVVVPIDLASLRNKVNDGGDLYSYGLLGVWAAPGPAFFQNATITVDPDTR
jgi:serine/threonine protein kinase